MERVFGNVATVVKKYREKLGNLSQLEMSNKLGYKNGQFISNVERGLCGMPFKKLNDTAKILNIDVTLLTAAVILDTKETLSNFTQREIE